MDLTNAILSSVYPHQQGNATDASNTLMGNMVDNQLNGHLVRISPNAFIYLSNDTDDDGNTCPSCHIVVSTDSDHYVGGLSTDIPVNQSDDNITPNPEPVSDNGCDGDTSEQDANSVVLPVGEIVPFVENGQDDTNNDTDNDLDIADLVSDAQPAPTVDDNIDVQPAPDADIAAAIDTPIDTTMAPAVDVVNDQNDMIKTELEEKCDDDESHKDSKLDESAYIEYPHQVENLDEALQQISTALTNRYGGSIILHEGHCLTHVRKDGLVDKVQAVQGKYKIRTHKLKV